MSRIDNLLAELCPDGVKHVELQHLFTLRNGYTPSKSNAAFWSGGTIPWFRMEDIRENGGVLADSIQHIPEIAVKGGGLFPANSMLVATSATIGEHALVTVPHLSNQRFTSLSLKPYFTDLVDMRFIYYYGFVLDHWCLNNTTTSSFSSVDMTGFKKFRFPVPPLEVQREIVRILDQFTQLEAELEAELEARRRQYDFHRTSLLTKNPDGACIPLGELADFKYGYTARAADTGKYRFIRITDISPWGKLSPEGAKYVDVPDAAGDYVVKPGDLLVARTGATFGKTMIFESAHPAVYASFLIRIRFKSSIILPEFYWHFAQSSLYWSQANAMVSTGGQPQFNANVLKQVMVPVPPLEEQALIIDTLGRFDALVNDLSSGLPAEIAARRKQYEHYRDRLLTFKEAAA